MAVSYMQSGTTQVKLPPDTFVEYMDAFVALWVLNNTKWTFIGCINEKFRKSKKRKNIV